MKTQLVDLVDNRYTDKNTAYTSPIYTSACPKGIKHTGPYGHTYLPLYEELLKDKKDTAKNILEIGISQGGSIKLWSDYFTHADIYGVDIIMRNSPPLNYLKRKSNVHLIINDAYTENFVNETFNSKSIKFDMILDDGPHTLESMKKFVRLYTPLLKEDGILMIEDIFYTSWFDELKKEVPNNLLKYVDTYDRRNIKNKHNDLVFVINKSKKAD
jgi:hypothetical protein